ncbi:MAG: VTT domain-containing protein [Bacteroidetes bacterium]|nr:VTT domain-containing protein [Bacteroidota bacterium]
MEEILVNYFVVYGYLAVFAVVLLQELGMPGLPNELVLLYFGHLSRQAGLSYPLVIALVVVADMLGSVILYLLFYYGRTWLVQIKPRWVKLPEKKVFSLKQKMASGRGRPIFIAKLTPFVRSYIPVVAGLLQVEPALYGRIIVVTAIIWSGGWVTAGWLLYF